ncbi:hypothetical protein [Bradyrhizobium sp. DOA9]|uniref:hypothetical protein n=1 Tax=Bradyrhizobium sp. DOA9 TaxID=1126627 RepID=UPI0004698581|nr:hypothetical protein [Bradyrhizobium sp. DOA9]GAJ37699.1 hypothetical protein BDOA9_0203170 [Bradyrhizobium sp. DOA9]
MNKQVGSDSMYLRALGDVNLAIEDRIRTIGCHNAASLWSAQDQLASALANAGIHFEDRGYPLCLRPLTITPKKAFEMQIIAERFVQLLDVAAELYCCDIAVRDLFPSYNHLVHWTTRLPKRRPIVTVGRLDGLFAIDGHYKIIETNTEGPGGVVQTGLAANIWSNTSNPLTQDLPFERSKQRFKADPNTFVRELKAAYHAETGDELRSAAVLNFKGRYANEVDWIEKGLAAVSVKSQVLDIRALKRTSDGLFGPDGDAIQLTYNKVDVRDVMAAHECSEYLEACARQEVVSINPWIAQWILSDKAILALFSDPRFRSNFSSEHVSLIERHVPWTRVIRPGQTTDPDGRLVDLLEYIRLNQSRCVLKPSNATRGEGVQVGPLVTPSDWDKQLSEAANGSYVVQEYIHTGQLTALNLRRRSVEAMSWGLDCYIFSGQFAGFHARASADAVMNIGQRGILLPVA